MAAKIGILGESTVITVNTTTTMYTVPADKAARIQILYAVEQGANTGKMSLLIGSPGTEIQIHNSVALNIDMWYGYGPIGTEDPLLSRMEHNSVGHISTATQIDLTDTNDPSKWYIVPMPQWWFLSTGDTVKIHIGAVAALAVLCQVMGVEDDA